ncbi:TlpA family protein disulfide reductase [bacterium]|nr:TlpA family protein disulfide reductase [bacterium]
MKTFILTLALLFTSMTLSAQVGKQAPEFSLKDKDGKVYSLESLKGKVVVLNFWATWCPPCKAEIPDLKRVYDKYGEKGVEILGVSLDNKGWSVLKPFVEKWDINYPIVLGGIDIARDYGNVRSIPTTFIINREGKVIDRHVGSIKEDVLVSKFEKLL